MLRSDLYKHMILSHLIVGFGAACTSVSPPYIVEPTETVDLSFIGAPLANHAVFHNAPQVEFSGNEGIQFDDQTLQLAHALKSAGVATNISFSSDAESVLEFDFSMSTTNVDYGTDAPKHVPYLFVLAEEWWLWNEFEATVTISRCGENLRTYTARTRVDNKYHPGVLGLSEEQVDQQRKDMIDLGGTDLAAKLIRQIVEDETWLRAQIALGTSCDTVTR